MCAQRIADTWSFLDIPPQPQPFHPMMTALMNAATKDSINFSTLVASLKLGWGTEPLIRPPIVENLQTPGPEDGCITTLARFVEGTRFLSVFVSLEQITAHIGSDCNGGFTFVSSHNHT